MTTYCSRFGRNRERPTGYLEETRPQVFGLQNWTLFLSFTPICYIKKGLFKLGFNADAVTFATF